MSSWEKYKQISSKGQSDPRLLDPHFREGTFQVDIFISIFYVQPLSHPEMFVFFLLFWVLHGLTQTFPRGGWHEELWKMSGAPDPEHLSSHCVWFQENVRSSVDVRKQVYTSGCTHSDLAGLVESSHPVLHVSHIVSLEEVTPRNCINDCRGRQDTHEYPLFINTLYYFITRVSSVRYCIRLTHQNRTLSWAFASRWLHSPEERRRWWGKTRRGEERRGKKTKEEERRGGKEVRGREEENRIGEERGWEEEHFITLTCVGLWVSIEEPSARRCTEARCHYLWLVQRALWHLENFTDSASACDR